MNALDFLCFLALSGLTGLMFMRRWRRLGVPLVALSGVAAFVTLLAAVAYHRHEPVPIDAIPHQVAERKYVSSDSCRSCHPDQYRSWHRTFHRTMTQVVSPDTVVASFDGSEVPYRDKKFRFERQGDTFWVVSLSGLGRETDRRRVVMSTGSHHYQVYWTEGDTDREPNEIPLYWNIAERRWIPKQSTLLEPTADGVAPGHWNTRCIKCHSTGGVPGLDSYAQVLNTEVGEFGIACEACHGPGADHIRRHQNPVTRYRERWQDQPDDSMVNPARLSSRASTFVCGRCHANYLEDMDDFLERGFDFLPGDETLGAKIELLAYDPAKAEASETNTPFWRDGTCRVGGDELNAHVKSPCFERGELSCLSCHSMHHSDPNDQLGEGMDGNQACLQCHKSFANNIEAHTHHAATSSGSLCYNCHMPHTTYALSTAMRSHRIDSPDAQASDESGRPNACNLCHLDRTLQWTADHLTEWYDQPESDFAADRRTIADSVLWSLQGNALHRAIAAWHAGWEPAQEASGTKWQARFLAELLQDPYPQVRFIAGRSLRTLPGFETHEYDFLAAESEQRNAALAVTRQWLESLDVKTKDRAAVLIDDDGAFDQETANRLLTDRDNSPIAVPE